jgi:hypothetical protein
MVGGFRSKQSHRDGFADASFDNPCSDRLPQPVRFFRPAKIPTKALLATATQSCILRMHLIRRLQKLPVYKTA